MKKVIKKLNKMAKKGILSKNFDPWSGEKDKKNFNLFDKVAGKEISAGGIVWKINKISGGGSGMGEYPPEINIQAIKFEKGFFVTNEEWNYSENINE